MAEKSKNIKSQDILILLKILSSGGKYGHTWNTITLSRSLYISQSEVSESLKRSAYIGFMDSSRKIVYKKALLEFLVHGLKYVFPVKPGHLTRGIETAHSAVPLRNMIVQDGNIYVWAYAHGSVTGEAVEPLYHTVPKAALEDHLLYELLSLADALRIGKAREKTIAENELKKRILDNVLF